MKLLKLTLLTALLMCFSFNAQVHARQVRYNVNNLIKRRGEPKKSQGNKKESKPENKPQKSAPKK